MLSHHDIEAFEDLRESDLERNYFNIGDMVIGPCGYGVEIVELRGAYVVIEHYNGDRELLRRDTIRGHVVTHARA